MRATAPLWDQESMKGVPSHVVAGCFAMCAFSVAVAAGLAASNDAATVLIRAILAMIVCYPLGWIVGAVCRRAIDEYVRELDAAAGAEGDAGEAEPPGEAAAPAEDQEEVVIV